MLGLRNSLPSGCRLSVPDSEGEDSNSVADPYAELTIVDNNDIPCDESGSKTGSASSNNRVANAPLVTHIIVLIHGWMGNPAEMGYIKESIQNAANKNVACTEDNVRHRFIIHSAACNEDRTDDGIAVGGTRIAAEINDLVRHIVLDGDCSSSASLTSSPETAKFTLSIVGNSLGGLYARHALAGINWTITDESSLSPPTTLLPLIFVTTATPHLGISQHTYIPLPRAAEFVVAQGMKETGRDFFRFTPVLEDLFHKEYFVDPLSKFLQRIAYINVYGTDFQVPTATAAFWAPGSDSPHHRVPAHLMASENDNTMKDNDADIDSEEPVCVPKAIVMTLSTPRRLDLLNEEEDGKSEADVDEEKKEGKPQDNNDPSELYRSWSKRLDRLGWTKVLVDVREDVPTVNVPVGTSEEFKSNENSKEEDKGTDTSDGGEKEKGMDAAEAVENAESEKDETDPNLNKDTWTAAELLAEFQGGLLTAGATSAKRRSSFWDLKPRIPLGHTVMIANAKDEFNKKVTSGGKPVMDYLGLSMVRTLTSNPYSTDVEKAA